MNKKLTMNFLEIIGSGLTGIVLGSILLVMILIIIGLSIQIIEEFYDFYRSIFRGIISIFKKPKRRRRQTP